MGSLRLSFIDIPALLACIGALRCNVVGQMALSTGYMAMFVNYMAMSVNARFTGKYTGIIVSLHSFFRYFRCTCWALQSAALVSRENVP